MTPSHYLNQCSNIVYRTPRYKLQWNFSQNSCFSIQRNAVENIVCKITAILSMERWVNYSEHKLIIKYCSLNKMADIWQMTFSWSFSYENIIVFDLNPLSFVPKGPINNRTTLVQLMAWWNTDDKPLLPPMMCQFINSFPLVSHTCIGKLGHHCFR